MGRKAGRRPAEAIRERWKAVAAPYGRYVIVNEQGEQPLRDRDAFAQAEAAHLAAAAPALKATLEMLLRRLEYLEPAYTRDRTRLVAARAELSEATVPAEELFRLMRRRPQLELDLDPV